MAAPLLATKLYIPQPRPKVVFRPQLIERLSEGLRSAPSMTLISAPAGFGKTTLVSKWVAGCGQPAAWLSLDEADNDPTHFLTYLVAALQTIASGMGAGALGALHAAPSEPRAIEAVLRLLLNEIAAQPQRLVLVLDDYHVLESKPIDQ